MTLAPAVIAASVALIVAVLTPAAASLRARRQAINEKFDAAISALLMVQATRHVATGIQRHYHPGDDEEYRRFTVRMAEESISEFIAQTAAARAALASISRYVPEVREWVTTAWELTEEREPEQRRLIELRRASAVRTERLLRQSLPPAVSTR